jgi:hypothetical protein
VCVCVGFRGRGGGDRGGYDVEGVRGPDGDGETGGPGNPKGDLFWRLRRQNLVFIEGWKGAVWYCICGGDLRRRRRARRLPRRQRALFAEEVGKRFFFCDFRFIFGGCLDAALTLRSDG